MKLTLTCDANWDSKVEKVVYLFSDAGYRHFFEGKNYGEGLSTLGVVLMCREKDYNFKQRVRYSEEEKKLYFDVMLDIDFMRNSPLEKCTRAVVDSFKEQASIVIKKYQRKKGFDGESLIQDIQIFLEGAASGKKWPE